MDRPAIALLYLILAPPVTAAPAAAPVDTPAEAQPTSMAPDGVVPDQARQALNRTRQDLDRLREQHQEIDDLTTGLARMNVSAPAPPHGPDNISQRLEAAENALNQGYNSSAAANITEAREQINQTRQRLEAQFMMMRANASRQMTERTSRLSERLDAVRSRIAATERAGLLSREEASMAREKVTQATRKIQQARSNASAIENASTTEEILSSANQTSRLLEETDDDLTRARSIIATEQRQDRLPTTPLLQAIAVLAGGGFLYWRLGRHGTTDGSDTTGESQEESRDSGKQSGEDE